MSPENRDGPEPCTVSWRVWEETGVGATQVWSCHHCKALALRGMAVRSIQEGKRISCVDFDIGQSLVSFGWFSFYFVLFRLIWFGFWSGIQCSSLLSGI